MAYLALYRQYRPKLFDQVIGQEHITTVLKNQIKSGSPSHAYLFCGPRGTGKTSSAKILARAINCLHPVNGEPCGECENCRFSAVENPDVIEIDAASNTGVDKIRELIEQVQFMPMQLKYRVFIIDEVHMLSGSAFNALLKTIEEPPAHVLFILATTEPQKLPATVISRCQRFDFHRISIHHIVTALRGILKQTGVTIELEGLQLIARSAEGSLRDALSLTDQCIALAGKSISSTQVYDVLGSMEQEHLFSMADMLLTGDAKGALTELDTVSRMGRSLTVFVSDLIAHFRALIVTSACGECSELLECTDDMMQRYMRQISGADAAVTRFALEELLSAQGKLKQSASPRTLLESSIMRICCPMDDDRVSALEARIARLETARYSAPSEFTPAKPSAKPTFEEYTPVSCDELMPIEPPEEYIPEPPEPETLAARDTAAVFVSEAKPVSAEKPVSKVKPSAAPAVEPAAEVSPAPLAAPASDDNRQEAEGFWKAVLPAVQKQNPMAYIYAKNGVAVSLKDDVLTVRFPKSKEREYNVASNPKSLTIVQAEAEKLRHGVTISYMLERLTGQDAELFSMFDGKITIE